MRRGEVVQPAGGEELTLGPEDRGRLGVRNDDVVPADLRRIDSARPATRPASSASRSSPAGSPSPKTGFMCCCLSSASPSFTARSRWMASCGKRSSGPGGRQVLRAVEHHEAPGELQFAVQPGVQQRSAVDLDAGLQPAELARGGFGLELERRRIGVRAQDVEPGGGPGALRASPRRSGRRRGSRRRLPRRILPALSQGCSSSRPVKPASSSRRAASWTAWKLDGDAVTYAPRSWMWSAAVAWEGMAPSLAPRPRRPRSRRRTAGDSGPTP